MHPQIYGRPANLMLSSSRSRQTVFGALIARLALCVCLIWLATPHSLQGADNSTRQIAVSMSTLGMNGQGGSDARESETAFLRFMEKLSAYDGFEATSSNKKHGWRNLHHPDEFQAHAQLLQIDFGQRTDWIAFYSDGNDNTDFTMLRRPATHKVKPIGTYLHTIPPGPEQVTHNAVAELASDLFLAITRQSASRQRPRVAIKVMPWEVEQEALLGDSEFESFMPAGTKAVEGIEALTWAAAGRLGWNPFPKKTLDNSVPRHRFMIRVGAGPTRYCFDVTHESGSTTSTLKQILHEDFLYDGITDIMRQLAVWNGAVTDFLHIDKKDMQLLGFKDGTLFYTSPGELHALNVNDNREIWNIPKPERTSPQYAAAGQGDSLEIYKYTPGLYRVDLLTGSITRYVRDASAEMPWGFSVAARDTSGAPGGADFAISTGRELRLYVSGKNSWEFTAKGLFRLGPTIFNKHVYAGNDSGEVFCLPFTENKPVWKFESNQRSRGPVSIIDDRMIAGSVEGVVTAISIKTGKKIWDHKLGDILLCKPDKVGGNILVAGSNNRLRLLAADTGKTVAEHRTSDWPTGVKHLPGHNLIACADRSGEIVFLDATSLRASHSISLGVKLRKGLLYGDKIPAQWDSTEILIEEEPSIIVSGENNVVYIIPLPSP